jgi:hypothetical protein
VAGAVPACGGPKSFRPSQTAMTSQSLLTIHFSKFMNLLQLKFVKITFLYFFTKTPHELYSVVKFFSYDFIVVHRILANLPNINSLRYIKRYNRPKLMILPQPLILDNLYTHAETHSSTV